MEKYLFNDGTNVIREVESEKELEALIESATEPDRVRIWVFNTSEWISVASFRKQKRNNRVPEETIPPSPIKPEPVNSGRQARSIWKQGLIVIISAIAIFLIYNFTKVTWNKAPEFEMVAPRPSNVPEMDMDSLVQSIETSRSQKLDKTTRTNLRIRNTWPDRLQLKVQAGRDMSTQGGSRFYDLRFSIDNSTGYQVDEAIVEFEVWGDGRKVHSDTLRFSDIGYAYPSRRSIDGEFRGDSIAVYFSSARAKSFNFCYSSDKESNYGNLNDRWFCR